MSATKDEYDDRLLHEVLTEAPHLSTDQLAEGYRAAHRPDIPTGEPGEHPMWRFRLLLYRPGEVVWRPNPKARGELHPVWADTGLPVEEA
jgi:hypothetical protein